MEDERVIIVMLAGTEYMLREVRAYNGMKAAMLLARYVRKSEPAMQLAADWLEARLAGDLKSMLKAAAHLWDTVEPELLNAADDIFVLLELATGIPADMLKDAASFQEVVALLQAVCAINDVSGIIARAREVMPMTAKAMAEARHPSG